MEPLETAHRKGHRLRTFLFEIFTVTVGLFIALALNDLVDWHSHRQLVRTAETSLHEEIKSNAQSLDIIRKQIATETLQLDDDLAVLSRLRAVPDGVKPPHEKVQFEFRISDFDDTAWKTAQTTNAFSYMPYKDAEEFSTLYGTQALVYQNEQRSVDAVLSAAAIVVTKPSGAELTHDEIDETVRRIGEAKMRVAYLEALVNSLDKSYQGYLSRHP